MHELISSLMDNDSVFGKIMTRLGIIIAANLMFIVFSIPVVTIGASYAALYHVMLKTLRGDGVINPFKQFWKGFKGNFKQATITWVIAAALAVLFYMEFRITNLMEGDFAKIMRVGLIAVAAVALILLLYLFPVMAAFADTLPHLLRNCIFFAVKNPLKMIIILAANVVPVYATYLFTKYLPLFAFLWIMFGFGAIVMLGAALLLPLFKPFLPEVDAEGNFIVREEISDGQGENESDDSSAAVEETVSENRAENTPPANAAAESGPAEKSQKEILDDMKKLGM